MSKQNVVTETKMSQLALAWQCVTKYPTLWMNEQLLSSLSSVVEIDGEPAFTLSNFNSIATTETWERLGKLSMETLPLSNNPGEYPDAPFEVSFQRREAHCRHCSVTLKLLAVVEAGHPCFHLSKQNCIWEIVVIMSVTIQKYSHLGTMFV